jgi:hypothetical protein
MVPPDSSVGSKAVKAAFLRLSDDFTAQAGKIARLRDRHTVGCGYDRRDTRRLGKLILDTLHFSDAEEIDKEERPVEYK